jgi:hypothetical protein
MILILYSYRTRPEKIEAVRCLYRDWQQILLDWGPVSTELLANPQDPAEMIMLARFPDDDTAWKAAESAWHCAWYARLVGLAESGPLVDHYQVVEPD